MASVLAIVSKKIFERQARLDNGHLATTGDVLPVDRYDSNNKRLETLKEGGTLFMVTVRPGDELWLVAVLLEPRHEADHWASSPNPAPITDITSLIPDFRFDTGKGIRAKTGALGMSLQTPRHLTEGDVDLLQAALSVKATLQEEKLPQKKLPQKKLPQKKLPQKKLPQK
ncbi:MAG: hypothetical protein JRH20_13390, partial [Deltaproteobacteria bacterium]|nr:hypothetical protein [Deltaproteobacteria bacterium]